MGRTRGRAPSQNAPNVAWALLVVSSQPQAETLPHQRAWADREAVEHGWHIDEYIEEVGSGREGVRAPVQSALSRLRALEPARRPSWLLLTRVDRVGRGEDILETQYVFHELKKLGVRAFARQPYGEVKLDTAVEQLFLAVQAVQSHQENAVRSDKALQIFARRRDAGLAVSNRRPYGLKVGPDGRDVACEPQAEAVREAFRMNAAGKGVRQIRDRLTEIAPPISYKNGSTYSIRWHESRISGLLRQRAYIGPVIDEVTFLRAAHVRSAFTRTRQAATRYPWPLSGALRCYCGRAMNGMPSGAAGRRIRYYACKATWTHSRIRAVRADKLEPQFIALLEQLRADPKLIARYRNMVAPSRSPKVIERAVATARAERVEIIRQRSVVWDMHLRGKVREDDVQARLDDLSIARDAVDVRIAELDGQRAEIAARRSSTRDAEAVVARAAERFAAASVEEQREISRAVALVFGGLCVEEDDTLTLRAAVDDHAQRRRKASER